MIKWINAGFLCGLLLSGLIPSFPHRDVNAQQTPPSTGSMIVKITADGTTPMEGLQVSYTQVSQDFLIGYAGPPPQPTDVEGLPGFNLELECIPWVEVEPQAGYYPQPDEAAALTNKSRPGVTIANDCLLYFGEDARDDFPEDLQGLDFAVFFDRTREYLTHAVRYETAGGVEMFILKEPVYPGANLLELTSSQWLKIVKLACQTIRELAPQATIVIEIIPQYLPSRGYVPYSFLDNLIRDGVSFDAIMLVFSPPVSARFTKAGYPDFAWISSQLDVFSDLGKQLMVRFSGVTSIKDETSRQAWLEETYAGLFDKQTVIGIYWDEILRFPARLTAVTWDPTPTEPPSSAAITIPMLAFIRDRTTSGMAVTDGSGQIIIQAYAGDYDITVQGVPGVTRAHIYRGQERRLDLALASLTKTPQPGQGEVIAAAGDNDTIPGELSPGLAIGLGIVATILIGFGYYIRKRYQKAQGRAAKTHRRRSHE